MRHLKLITLLKILRSLQLPEKRRKIELNERDAYTIIHTHITKLLEYHLKKSKESTPQFAFARRAMSQRTGAHICAQAFMALKEKYRLIDINQEKFVDYMNEWCIRLEKKRIAEKYGQPQLSLNLI